MTLQRSVPTDGLAPFGVADTVRDTCRQSHGWTGLDPLNVTDMWSIKLLCSNQRRFTTYSITLARWLSSVTSIRHCHHAFHDENNLYDISASSNDIYWNTCLHSLRNNWAQKRLTVKVHTLNLTLNFDLVSGVCSLKLEATANYWSLLSWKSSLQTSTCLISG